MNQEIFGVRIYHTQLVDKEKIDNALIGIDLKRYTKNNKYIESLSWDCRVNTGFNCNLIGEDEPWVKVFFEAIRTDVVKYIRHMNRENKKFTPELNYWVNYYEKNDFQERHNHIGVDALSFNYIHKCPENGGSVKFHNLQSAMNAVGHPTLIETVEEDYVPHQPEGTLIIFPSWLDHSVTINQSDAPRITISGNINLKVED